MNQFVAALERKEDTTRPQVFLSITEQDGYRVLVTSDNKPTIDRASHLGKEEALSRAWQIVQGDLTKYYVIRVNPDTLPNDPVLLKLVITGMQERMTKLETHLQEAKRITY